MQSLPESPHAPPVLIICGMHRSGTSIAASLCQSAGIDVGSELVPAHESNQTGHFEDLDFYRFHESALDDNGRIPAGYGIFDAPPDVSASRQRQAQALVAVRRSRGNPWGWKDPRTALFLDFWAALLPEARFLFVFRDPAEVADSLYRRGEKRFQDGGEEAFRTWYRYNSLIRDFCQAHPDRVLIRELRQIAADPALLCTEIRHRLGVPMRTPESRFRSELLRDGRLTPDTPPNRGLVRGCERLFGELQCMARDERKAAHSSSISPTRDRRRVAVVIPVHRLPLLPTENVSFRQLRHQLLCEDRIVLAPESLDTTSLGLTTRRFADDFFRSIEAYSRLMLSQDFYAAFRDYEYILIHQLDCLTFSSDLESWCERGWDYAGAPWFPNHEAGPGRGLWAVGNGGLSLRRVPTFLRMLERPDIAQAIATGATPEDVFWSFEAPRFDPTFTIPPPHEAAAFAVESSPRYCFALNGNSLPFGCHYWPRIDPQFWQTFLAPDVRMPHVVATHPLDDPLHPDHHWMRSLVGHILGAATAGRSPEEIADLLTSDMSQDALEASPTKDGISQIFARLLGRAPPADWFAFWVGKPGARLLDIRRDLAAGGEFRARCAILSDIGVDDSAARGTLP